MEHAMLGMEETSQSCVRGHDRGDDAQPAADVLPSGTTCELPDGKRQESQGNKNEENDKGSVCSKRTEQENEAHDGQRQEVVTMVRDCTVRQPEGSIHHEGGGIQRICRTVLPNASQE